MANQKLTELTQVTTFSDTDIVYIVIDPGGNPVSRKITLGDLLENCLKVTGGVVSGDIALSSSNHFYIGDSDTDGTWRIGRSGDNLIFQRRESSLWVTKGQIVP